MQSRVLAGTLALALAACAAPPPGAAPEADGGVVTLAAVGEPFLIAAKLPACVLTVLVAGPVGAVATVARSDDGLSRDVRQGLAEGIDQNCGPPYVVAPY